MNDLHPFTCTKDQSERKMENTDEEQARLGRHTAIVSMLAGLTAQAKQDMKDTLENLDRILVSDLPMVHEQSMKCLHDLEADVSIKDSALATSFSLFCESYSLRNISQFAFCRLQQLLDFRSTLMDIGFSFDIFQQDILDDTHTDSWEDMSTVVTFLNKFATDASMVSSSERGGSKSPTDCDFTRNEDMNGSEHLHGNRTTVDASRNLDNGDTTDDKNNGDSPICEERTLSKCEDYCICEEEAWYTTDQREVTTDSGVTEHSRKVTPEVGDEEEEEAVEEEDSGVSEMPETFLRRDEIEERSFSLPAYEKLVHRLGLGAAFNQTSRKICSNILEDSIIVTHEGGISTTSILRHILPWIRKWESFITVVTNSVESKHSDRGSRAQTKAVFDRLFICDSLKQLGLQWRILRTEMMENVEKYCLHLADLQHMDSSNLFVKLMGGPPEEKQEETLGRLRNLLKGPALRRPEETVHHFQRLIPPRCRRTPVSQASLDVTNHGDASSNETKVSTENRNIPCIPCYSDNLRH